MKKGKVVQHHHKMIPWKFHKDWIWIHWDIVDLKNDNIKGSCDLCPPEKGQYEKFKKIDFGSHNQRKIPWKFCNDQTWLCWGIVDLKNGYLFVCVFVCFQF